MLVEPGTPPVTEIESLSSAGAADVAGAASAGAGFDASGRIEFPTVPSFIAGTEEEGDVIGVLTPS